MGLILSRGDIVLAKLPEIGEHIQKGEKRILIISNGRCIRNSPVITYVCLTSKEKNNLPTHVELEPNKYNGLNVKSTILCEQIMSLDKTRIIKKLGTIDNETLKKVEKSLLIQLGIKI
jgi:mRNA interferase MazF